LTQKSPIRRPGARVAAALTIIAAFAVGDLLAGPRGSAAPALAANCLKPEVTKWAGPTEILPNPGNFYTFVLQVDNPNPAGSCNDGLDILISFTKTANPVNRMYDDNGFGVYCTSDPTGGQYAHIERCGRQNFGGGEHGELLFNMGDLAVGEVLTATVKPQRGSYGAAANRPGKTSTATVTITGVMAPTLTPAPASGSGAASKPTATPTPAPAPKPPGPRAGAANAPTVQAGASGDTVTAIQYLLRQGGQDVVVDGDFGEQTAGAVKSFQEAKGLTADGIVGAQTWDALWVTVKQGDQGDAVSAAQQLLAARGLDVAVDGDFGPQTDETVRDFQQQKGLTVDGVVGPGTWATLVAPN
jgi:peptidoglycan hydrolase-like protein with peptidoglycan-binding domain